MSARGLPNDAKKAPLRLVLIVGEVFSKINIDTVGPLPESPDGKKYILTAICEASRYPEAVPLNDITSVSIINGLIDIFSRLGFPKIVQCDQGTSFTSNLTTEFLTKFGVQIRHSSVYHPQSNMVERFHRSLKRVLSVMCKEAAGDWAQTLPLALFAFRTAVHESVGFTPSEIVFGKNLRTPETLLYDHWMGEIGEVENKSVIEHVF